jgi:cold shock CspA family protein
VVKYFCDKGYGFLTITETGEDLFVHWKSAYREIKEGDRVTCDVVKSTHKPGSLCAENVVLDMT